MVILLVAIPSGFVKWKRMAYPTNRHAAAATSGQAQVVGNPTIVEKAPVAQAPVVQATVVETGNEGNQPVWSGWFVTEICEFFEPWPTAKLQWSRSAELKFKRYLSTKRKAVGSADVWYFHPPSWKQCNEKSSECWGGCHGCSPSRINEISWFRRDCLAHAQLVGRSLLEYIFGQSCASSDRNRDSTGLLIIEIYRNSMNMYGIVWTCINISIQWFVWFGLGDFSFPLLVFYIAGKQVTWTELTSSVRKRACQSHVNPIWTLLNLLGKVTQALCEFCFQARKRWHARQPLST